MLPKIFCGNPTAQFASYRSEIFEAMRKVCETGPYILGPEVEAFEAEFAAYHDVKYCVGVGSGTDALTLAMKCLDIACNDEVITVSHTALATATAIVMAGATPVLVDIEEDYFTLDPSKIEAAITPKTKAIVAVHLYGQPCNMDAIMAIAKKYHLIVIEDCAQAHGAIFQGCKVGTIGDIGCFSFYPTKNLGAIGDAGGVITNNLQVYERLKRMRQYGWDQNRVSQEPGVVSRLDELQAAILRVKLRYLDSDNEKRRAIAQEYQQLLQDSGILLPQERENCKHVYHLYVVKSHSRDALKKKLCEFGIEAGIHYTHPVHFHQGYKDKIVLSKEGLKVTEKVINEILTLPIYPEFSVQEMVNLKGVFYV